VRLRSTSSALGCAGNAGQPRDRRCHCCRMLADFRSHPSVFRPALPTAFGWTRRQRRFRIARCPHQRLNTKIGAAKKTTAVNRLNWWPARVAEAATRPQAKTGLPPRRHSRPEGGQGGRGPHAPATSESIHIVVATVTTAAGLRLLILGLFGDQRIAGQEQRRNTRRILQGRPRHLGRVDYARLD